jgi:[protein-PII] uridylyltransferase
LRVAESFAANGVDVLEARMHTRSDGLVVDSFQVRDDRTGSPVRSERWERARTDIEAGLEGIVDTGSKVAERASAYEKAGDFAGRPRVECLVDSATDHLVVVIKCSNRIGRLAEILAVLGDSGLEIRLAKLDSRGDELVDTFHVRGDRAIERSTLTMLERQIAVGLTP